MHDHLGSIGANIFVNTTNLLDFLPLQKRLWVHSPTFLLFKTIDSSDELFFLHHSENHFGKIIAFLFQSRPYIHSFARNKIN